MTNVIIVICIYNERHNPSYKSLRFDNKADEGELALSTSQSLLLRPALCLAGVSMRRVQCIPLLVVVINLYILCILVLRRQVGGDELQPQGQGRWGRGGAGERPQLRFHQ